jgi:glutathione S-transferase
MHIMINTMTLYWGPISPFVRKVLIAAMETGLRDRISLVRTLVAMNASNADLMHHNPLSKIPTLVTETGMVLFDSDVICEYFDTLHHGIPLVPKQGAARWQALRWNALGSGMMDALVLWRNERMRPQDHRSKETLDTYALKTNATLALIDREITQIATADFGLGQIAIGCMLGYLDLRFPDVAWRTEYPAISCWYATFNARPSAKATDPSLDPGSIGLAENRVSSFRA